MKKKKVVQELLVIPEKFKLGNLLSSTKPIALTENETEYSVVCIKHFFQEHVLFQFKCTNTLHDQLLENVSVEVETGNAGWVIEEEIPADKIYPESTKDIFVSVRKPTKEFLPKGLFYNNLKFTVNEIDKESGEPTGDTYNDEYKLEDLTISAPDYISAQPIETFNDTFESFSPEETSQLQFKLTTVSSVEEGITQMIKLLGMAPCDNSEAVDSKKGKVKKHVLYLSGLFHGEKIVARVRMQIIQDGVAMELIVKSKDELLRQHLISIFS